MVNIHKQLTGFAIICDEEGFIREILRDDLQFLTPNIINTLFINLMEPGSRKKAMDFFIEVKNQGSTLNYELDIYTQQQVKSLSFLGSYVEGKILIIGASNEDDAAEFTNYLQEINNEQANLIRQLTKEKLQAEKDLEKSHDVSLEDLSRLNNELINLQRELSKKNAELERLNEMKNRFLGMAAHDLRSPLAIIQSYTEFLEHKNADILPKKQMKFLENIRSTTQFMLSLIEELLDVSKIESGKLELNTHAFDLAELIQKNTELNRGLADKKGIQLNLHCSDEHIMIQADQHKIEQVFNNLLSNAIKFSYPNHKIDLKMQRQKNRVRVSVRDYGKGISKDQKETIFQPFNQVSEMGTEGEKGTGLGLAIAKRIIEGHHGHIWVESEPGKGSVFNFTLPAEKQAETFPNNIKQERK